MVSRMLNPVPDPTRSSATTRIWSNIDTSTTPSCFDWPAGMETPPGGVRNASMVFVGDNAGAVPIVVLQCKNLGRLGRGLQLPGSLQPGHFRLPLSDESKEMLLPGTI